MKDSNYKYKHPLDYTLNSFSESYFKSNEKENRILSKYKIKKILSQLQELHLTTMKVFKNKDPRILTTISVKITPLLYSFIRAIDKVKAINNAEQFKKYTDAFFNSLHNTSGKYIKMFLAQDKRYRYLSINKAIAEPLIEKLSLLLVIALTESSDDRIYFIKQILYSLDQTIAQFLITHPDFNVSNLDTSLIPCDINEMIKDAFDNLNKQPNPNKIPHKSVYYKSIYNYVRKYVELNGTWHRTKDENKLLKNLRDQAEKDYTEFLIQLNICKNKQNKAKVFEKMLSEINILTDDKLYEEDLVDFLFSTVLDSTSGVPLKKTDISELNKKIQIGTDVYQQNYIENAKTQLAISGAPFYTINNNLSLLINELKKSIQNYFLIQQNDTDSISQCALSVYNLLYNWYIYLNGFIHIPLKFNSQNNNIDEFCQFIDNKLSGFEPYEISKKHFRESVYILCEFKNTLFKLSFYNKYLSEKSEYTNLILNCCNSYYTSQALHVIAVLSFVGIKQICVNQAKSIMKLRKINKEKIEDSINKIKEWDSYKILSNNIGTAMNGIVYDAYKSKVKNNEEQTQESNEPDVKK